MLSDLSVTAVVGACALLVIAGVMTWVARGAENGKLPVGGRVAVRTRKTSASPDALLRGNRRAAPFLQRYAVILAALAFLVIVLGFVNDVAAFAVHLVALVFLALAAVVSIRKADAGASGASSTPTTGRVETPTA